MLKQPEAVPHRRILEQPQEIGILLWIKLLDAAFQLPGEHIGVFPFGPARMERLGRLAEDSFTSSQADVAVV
ncbi:hypothetical protein D3C86_2170070 [compost metagenome]